jgi:hypothetical protein
MATYRILNRWTRQPITQLNAHSIASATQLAVKHRVSLASSNLSNANLSCSMLTAADLRGSSLSYTKLVACCLQHADLRGADLRGACLDYSLLRYADLRHANLRGASLVGTDLRNVNLIGADLRDINLSLSHVTEAKSDWIWGLIASELLRRDPTYLTTAASLVLNRDVTGHSGPFPWIHVLSVYANAHRSARASLGCAYPRGNDCAPTLLQHLSVNSSGAASRTRRQMTSRSS